MATENSVEPIDHMDFASLEEGLAYLEKTLPESDTESERWDRVAQILQLRLQLATMRQVQDSACKWTPPGW